MYRKTLLAPGRLFNNTNYIAPRQAIADGVVAINRQASAACAEPDGSWSDIDSTFAESEAYNVSSSSESDSEGAGEEIDRLLKKLHLTRDDIDTAHIRKPKKRAAGKTVGVLFVWLVHVWSRGTHELFLSHCRGTWRASKEY
jgi:hypothetical protein